ncbi:MAG: metallophosphoesterase [Bacteroidetes bacterium]|nr:metallophosphoesterase [Bacteroidota bacterium]
MERRNFIKNTSAAILSTAIVPEFLTPVKGNNLYPGNSLNGKLKGFIVSDAHFGWMNVQQPDPDFQQKMMQRIIQRFPDLDVLLDTGDAHHNDHHDNNDPYKARENWCNIIQGGCGQVPFYYVIGNHEIRSNEDDDPENRSNIMGSTSCRPYYSFDMKGIHFISFPELIREIYITEEEYAWLDLDLKLNKDKTIILLSHNNILGTTTGNEAGYRGIMDSDKMLGIFKKYPNVISWMHGHNHNYEIVEKQGMLFVSNGRIGGFDPSRGKHGIGGIYFEVTNNGLLVKCYSAEKDIFLEDISGDLTKELKIPTTLDPLAPCTYSYGVGGAKNKERFFVYNHHSGIGQKRELYVAGCRDAIINDDPYFTKYTERHAYHGLDKILLAAKINHGNNGFEYTNPGIKLNTNSNWWTTVTLGTSPNDDYNLYSYYRCPVDTDYKISINLKTIPGTKAGKRLLWLRLIVHDIYGRVLRIVQSEEITLTNGEQEHETILKVPPLDEHETIYSDPDSDKLVNIAVVASFSGMENGDVDIRSMKFSIADADGKTQDPGLVINNKKGLYNGQINEGENARISFDSEINDRDVIEAIAGGNKRMSFLVRHTDLEWQVRNAAVKDCGKYLEIKKMRNKLSNKMEIIIVPLVKTSDPYVHRIMKSEDIRIYPLSRGNKNLKVEIKEVSDNAQVQVFSYKRPVNVSNVSSWDYENNIVNARITKPGTILFHF